jgi:DNA-binding GntR family transcriptional regulator
MEENLSQKAYRYIHGKLTSGRLVPGSRLSNRALAKEIGISFTPVREALNRLVSVGLLEYRRGLGVFVPGITRRTIEEIFELRQLIECAAVEKICGRLKAETVAELNEHVEAMQGLCQAIQDADDGTSTSEWGEQLRHRDAAFHSTLLRAAGNRLIVDTVAGLQARLTPAFHRQPNGECNTTDPQVDLEHARLLELLRGDDVAAARSFMADHIQRCCDLALAAHHWQHMADDEDTFLGAMPEFE